MDTADVIERLRELEGVVRTSLPPEVKAEIAALYRKVLGQEFKPTSCRNCYHDAVVLCLLQMKRHGKMKEEQKYLLKRGVLLRERFGSSTFYTRQSLTDEKAQELLRKNPQYIDKFERYAEDWNKPQETAETPEVVQVTAEEEKTAQEASKANASKKTTAKRGSKKKK